MKSKERNNIRSETRFSYRISIIIMWFLFFVFFSSHMSQNICRHIHVLDNTRVLARKHAHVDKFAFTRRLTSGDTRTIWHTFACRKKINRISTDLARVPVAPSDGNVLNVSMICYPLRSVEFLHVHVRVDKLEFETDTLENHVYSQWNRYSLFFSYYKNFHVFLHCTFHLSALSFWSAD